MCRRSDPDVREALLVGSIPLHDAASVMTFANDGLGRHLRRIPDGELAFALTGHAGRNGVFEGNGIDIGIIRKQHQGYEDEKPFHGRPPFAAGAASHVFHR